MALRRAGHRRQRRRERILIVGMLAVAVASVVLVPWFVDWAHRPRQGDGTLTTVNEAMAIAEALGDRPNDDQLIRVIRDRDFSGRRLAIEFLGEGGYGDALPVLETIARDTTEADRFRVVALESVFRIAAHRGRTLAQEFESDRVLGPTAREILAGGEAISQRQSRLKPLMKYVP